ncbi:hypothetical protein QQF64_006929, partial [Cirrhinus molitorella]
MSCQIHCRTRLESWEIGDAVPGLKVRAGLASTPCRTTKRLCPLRITVERRTYSNMEKVTCLTLKECMHPLDAMDSQRSTKTKQ